MKRLLLTSDGSRYHLLLDGRDISSQVSSVSIDASALDQGNPEVVIRLTPHAVDLDLQTENIKVETTSA